MEELLGLLATHRFEAGDMFSAMLYAMVLRQLDPTSSRRFYWLNTSFQNKLNELTGMHKSGYLYQGIDSLLALVKAELGKHGSENPDSTFTENQGSEAT